MIKNSHRSAAQRTYDNDFFGRAYAPWLAGRPELGAPATALMQAVLAGEGARGEAAARHACAIPETLVISLTSACNRRCQFCGAADVIDGPSQRLPRDLIEAALSECQTLGVRRIALIGGEPTLYPSLICLLEDHPDFFFSIYTNGSHLGGPQLDRLSRLANYILIVNASATDEVGEVTCIASEVMAAMAELSARRLLFGYAATVHRHNLALFSRPETLSALHFHEPRLGVLFDYLPEYGNGADHLAVDPHARARFVADARALAADDRMMFLCTPEDEDIMGGCGAAGRSFVHLGPDGSLSPCPFVPYSQARFPEQSLLAALRGDYFSELRSRSRAWEALSGPCAYRSAEDELAEISARHGASHYAERHPPTKPTGPWITLRRGATCATGEGARALSDREPDR